MGSCGAFTCTFVVREDSWHGVAGGWGDNGEWLYQRLAALHFFFSQGVVAVVKFTACIHMLQVILVSCTPVSPPVKFQVIKKL